MFFFAAALPGAAAAQDSPVQPGDHISIRIFRDSVVTYTLLVGPRGFIVLPYAGDIHVSGVAGNSVQDSVRASLSRFMSPASVEATLLRRIRMLGDVARPGIMFVDRTYNLRDAVALAGGPTDAGHADEVILERGGVRRIIRDWRSDSVSLAAVESGDQIIIPRLPWYRRNAPYLVTSIGTLALTAILTLTR
jgi:polysaccharide export outer membrane protein